MNSQASNYNKNNTFSLKDRNNSTTHKQTLQEAKEKKISLHPQGLIKRNKFAGNSFFYQGKTLINSSPDKIILESKLVSLIPLDPVWPVASKPQKIGFL